MSYNNTTAIAPSHKPFFDNYGLLHLKPNEVTEENSWWRTGLYWSLKYLYVNYPIHEMLNTGMYIKREPFPGVPGCIMESTDRGTFHTYPGSVNHHLSHDDYTAIYCLALKSRWDISNLKIIDRDRLHPRDISFYMAVHYPKLRFPLLAIHNFFILIAFLQHFKTRNGVKILNTDQRLTSFMRMKCFDMKWSYKFFSWIIKKDKYFGSWNNVFKVYFEDDHASHPLIEESRKI